MHVKTKSILKKMRLAVVALKFPKKLKRFLKLNSYHMMKMCYISKLSGAETEQKRNMVGGGWG